MKAKPQIGKQYRYNTAVGVAGGKIIGKNIFGNLIMLVDPRSPRLGWTARDVDEMRKLASLEYKDSIDSQSTFFWVSPDEEYEEIDESFFRKHEFVEETKKEAIAKAEATLNEIKGETSKMEAAGWKEIKMSKKNPVEIVKSDLEEAMWRAAGDKLGKGATALASKGVKKFIPAEHHTSVDAIMNSEVGAMVVDLAIGWPLTMTGIAEKDPRAERLVREFRVQGAQKGMSVIFDAFAEQVMPMITSALDLIPSEETKARVEVQAPATAPALVAPKLEEHESDLEDLAEEQTEAKKKLAAVK